MSTSSFSSRDVDHYTAAPSSFASGKEAKVSLEKVIASIAKVQGYDAIDASAMAYIVNNVEKLLCSLPVHTHQMAVLGNRRTPSSRDFFAALSFSGQRLQPQELRQYFLERRQDPLSWTTEADERSSREPYWHDPLRECLPSESEDDSEKESENVNMMSDTIATRSRTVTNTTASTRKRRRKKFRPEMAEVPDHLPSLPPKHTWLSTPSYPAHSINLQPPLAFLDLKVSSNRLMEASLRGLIRATDAAALESQTQRRMIGKARSPSQIDTSAFDDSRATIDERAEENLQSSSSSFAIPGAPASQMKSEPKEDDESSRNKLKKGRSLSLRLRTPSVSTITVPIASGAIDDAEMANPTPLKKSYSHRPSVSLLGSQSAMASNFASHVRRNTFASTPWTATPTHGTFSWNASNPAASAAFSPINTPLTPGFTDTPLTPSIPFQYPPTPLDEDMRDQFVNQKDALVTSLALPPMINYKRTWYKKSSSSYAAASASTSNGQQTLIRS